MSLPRRAMLGGLLLLAAPLPALAAGGGGTAGVETFTKLPPVSLEFWDTQGLFHMVNIELTAVFPGPTSSVDKKIGEQVASALSAMPWEDFAKGNPAATVKAIALDVLRKNPSTEKVTEVLVIKLMMR